MDGKDPNNGNDNDDYDYNGGSTPNTFATTTTTTTVQPTLSPPPPPPFVFAILDVHALDGFFWNVFHAKLNAIVHELWPPPPPQGSFVLPNETAMMRRRPFSLSNLYRRMGLVPLLLQGAYYLWNANSTTTATPAARVFGLHVVTNNTNTTSSKHHPRHQFLQRYLLYVVLLCASPIVYDQWTDWIHHLGQRRQRQLEQEQVAAFHSTASPTGPTLDDDDEDQEEEEDEVEDVDHNETEPIQATRTTSATAPRQRQQRQQQQQEQQQQAHQNRVALQRQWQTAQAIQKGLDLVVPMARLLLLLSCWNHRATSTTQGDNSNHHNHKNNRSPPPLAMTTDLAMWLSGLAYTQQQEPQPPPLSLPKLQVSLAHRRYLWELLEQCGRLWILDGLSHWPVVWARWVGGNGNQTTTTTTRSPQRQQQQQTQQFCPYCRTHQDDIVVSVQTTQCCQQVYCYTCLYQALRQRQEEQEPMSMTMVDYHQNLACLQCGQGVVRLQPIVVDNHTNDHTTTNNSGQDNNDHQDDQDPTNSHTGRVCVVLEGAQRIIPGS
ncbi:hypothetical protein ACA910_010475 [Epithemia clementina (nom. ined.)]